MVVKGATVRERRQDDAAGALDAMLRQAHNRAKVQGVGTDLVGRKARQVARQAVGQAGQVGQASGQGADKGGTTQQGVGVRQVQDSKKGAAFPASAGVRKQLEAILSDPSAPPATRGQAARTLAEMDGLIGRHQAAPDRAGDMQVSELSRADLVAELARLRHIAALDGG